jgi:hypothetical protein
MPEDSASSQAGGPTRTCGLFKAKYDEWLTWSLFFFFLNCFAVSSNPISCGANVRDDGAGHGLLRKGDVGSPAS